MLAIKIITSGFIILGGAIVANALAAILGLVGWYDFLKSPKQAGILDYIWLFLIYPMILGGLGFVASLILK